MLPGKREWVKRILTILACVGLGVAAVAVVVQPPSRPFIVRRMRVIMGTDVTVSLVVRRREEAEGGFAAAFAAVEMVDRRMSTFKPDSELMQLNRTAHRAPIRVSDPLFHVLKVSREMSILTDGAFDVTCGSIIDLWRRAGRDGRLPTDQERAAVLARAGYRKLRLDEEKRTVSFEVEGMQAVLGAVAKGYAVGLAVRALREAGFPNALVEAGGDLMAVGSAPGGRPWIVGVQDPRRPEDPTLILRLAVRDRAVVTSGNYRRFTEIVGRRYSHIVDPRTALPVDAVPSVTVIGPDPTAADALATAVSVLGLDRGMKLIEARADTECLLVTLDDGPLTLHRSSGFAKHEQ